MLTFGGHPVELRKIDTINGPDVLVHCKHVTGLFSQAKAFREKKNFITNVYPWGVKTTEPAYITNLHNGDIGIACLTDTKQKFDELYAECVALL